MGVWATGRWLLSTRLFFFFFLFFLVQGQWLAILRQGGNSLLWDWGVKNVTSPSWSAPVFLAHGQVFYLDQQCYLYSLSAGFFSHLLWWLTAGWGRLHSWVFVEEIRASVKCVLLILQCGVTHDGGAPAFVACNILNLLPPIFSAVGVEVPLQSPLMSPLCLLDASFLSCFLTNGPFFGSEKSLNLFIHPGLLVWEWSVLWVDVTLVESGNEAKK